LVKRSYRLAAVQIQTNCLFSMAPLEKSRAIFALVPKVGFKRRMKGIKLSCADIFAGAGGFSLAASNKGFLVRLAVESDANAARTYRANFNVNDESHLLFADDVRSVDFDLAKRKVFPDGSPCDLLLGGPPCQGYSRHRNRDSGVGDERNGLIHAYFDCVETLKPSAFVLENVPGMLWERHKDYLTEFYRRGAEANYKIFEPVILDARDFGVPQRRKRVFILGIREDIDMSLLVWPPVGTHASATICNTNLDRQPWISCADAFDLAPALDPNDVHMKHGPELLLAFQNTPPNGGSRLQSGRVLKCHTKHDGHKDVYGRINPSLPAPTMTTACVNPSKGRFVHPTRHHGITVRQAARIQTFPDNFVFHGGLMAAGKQVGNAVPIKLGEAVIEALTPMLQTNAEANRQSYKHD
jgi:DNA (cytosine-5)-methyltransferase 1